MSARNITERTHVQHDLNVCLSNSMHCCYGVKWDDGSIAAAALTEPESSSATFRWKNTECKLCLLFLLFECQSFF